MDKKRAADGVAYAKEVQAAQNLLQLEAPEIEKIDRDLYSMWTDTLERIATADILAWTPICLLCGLTAL